MAISDGQDHGLVPAEERHLGSGLPYFATWMGDDERKGLEAQRARLNVELTTERLRRRALAASNGKGS